MIELEEVPHNLLCIILDGGKLFEHFIVIGKLQKSAHVSRMAPFGTQQRIEKNRKLRITSHKPTAERNTVRLIGELLGIDVVERLELTLFQNLSVQRRNAVDAIAIVNGQVSHVYLTVDDDLYGRVIKLGTCELVKFFDNSGNLRRNLFQKFQWPFLKCLSKNCMVGIGNH